MEHAVRRYGAALGRGRARRIAVDLVRLRHRRCGPCGRLACGRDPKTDGAPRRERKRRERQRGRAAAAATAAGRRWRGHKGKGGYGCAARAEAVEGSSGGDARPAATAMAEELPPRLSWLSNASQRTSKIPAKSCSDCKSPSARACALRPLVSATDATCSSALMASSTMLKLLACSSAEDGEVTMPGSCTKERGRKRVWPCPWCARGHVGRRTRMHEHAREHAREAHVPSTSTCGAPCRPASCT